MIRSSDILQIDPKDGEAYYQLGKVYEQQQEYRKAYSNYLKAEELKPELLQKLSIVIYPLLYSRRDSLIKVIAKAVPAGCL